MRFSHKIKSMLLFLVIRNRKDSKIFYCLSINYDLLFVSRPEVAEQSGDLSQIVPGPLFPR